MTRSVAPRTPPQPAQLRMPPKPLSPRPFALKSSAIAGRGAFATRTIPKGACIMEYKGERIDQEEADRRYPEDPDESHHTFLFNLSDDVVVDGAVGGSAARFINHSCEPNCEAVIDDDRIWIYALKTIREGQELVYDYQFILDEPHTPAAKRRYPCRCGAKTCRGTILAKKRKGRS